MRRWKELKANPNLLKNLAKRARMISAIRAFFEARGYLEVETPVVVAKPGMEPYLDPFETELLTVPGIRHRAFLITSPEYAMKKLLAAGVPKLYQIVKCFRNKEASGGSHNPEFTMLEWYRSGTDYRGIMDETEELVKDAAAAIGAERTVAGEWQRLSVREAFSLHAGVDLDAALGDTRILIEAASRLGHALPAESRFEDAFFAVFLNAVEPKLGLPCPAILHDYPVSMAALSRASKRDPRYAERFELYIGGLEIANAFSELTDAAEQRRRLEEERELRRSLGGKTDYGPDEDFLAALEAGMPESGGIALGVDRLFMALTGERDIRNITAFPADSMFDYSQK